MRPLDPFPGGDGCPLEAFRRRVIRAGWTVATFVVLGFALWLAWRDLPVPPCPREPAGGIVVLLNCRR
ncbi:hypothetical protein [Bosea eneae]